jgi:hypothetical protein
MWKSGHSVEVEGAELAVERGNIQIPVQFRKTQTQIQTQIQDPDIDTDTDTKTGPILEG